MKARLTLVIKTFSTVVHLVEGITYLLTRLGSLINGYPTIFAASGVFYSAL